MSSPIDKEVADGKSLSGYVDQDPLRSSNPCEYQGVATAPMNVNNNMLAPLLRRGKAFKQLAAFAGDPEMHTFVASEVEQC